MRKLCVLLTLVVCLGSLPAFSGGFQVSLHGQKQVGMGSIGTSLVPDASVMFYNPGGLGFMQQKYNFTGGVSFLRSIATFQKTTPSVYQETTDNPLGTPFVLYGAGKIGDKLGVGVAVNTPYGNKLKWNENWAGRFLIRDISLAAIFVQPTVSYKICPKVSIGAGFVIATGSVKLNKAVPVNDASGVDGKVHIEGSTINYGYNLGVMFKPVDRLNVGIDYRSKVEMNVEGGDATFTVPSSLASNFPTDNKVDVTLPLPANLDLGASYKINDKLLVGFSLNYVFWDVYDSLIFDFEQNTSTLKDAHNPREYSNQMIYRVGAQYNYNDQFSFRVGGYYDPTPCNEEFFNPETPSLDITALTCGVSWRPTQKLSVDASFIYMMGKEMDMIYKPDNFGGTYKTRFYIPGIGLSYSL